MSVKIVAIALLLLGCSLAAAAQRVVRIASVDYPPYAAPYLEGRGPAVILTIGAFAARGVRAEIDLLPWARAINEMKGRKYDGLLLVWPEEIARFGLRTSDPLFYSLLGVFLKADSRTQISGPESLDGIRLGIVRDYGYPPELLSTGARLDVVSDDQTNLKKLAAGRLGAALLEKAVGDHLLRYELPELCAKVVWSGKTLARLPLAIGFWDEALLREFNAGLKELKSSPEYAAIMAALEAPPAAPDARTPCRF